MDYVWFAEQIFITVIIPLLGVLTLYVIKWINVQAEKLKSQTNNELVIKYIDMLNSIIATCVVATNQTYVDALKAQGKFDKEAQKIAFEKTYNAVKEIISEEMTIVLSEAYEDLDAYIMAQIEFMVKNYKAQ